MKFILFALLLFSVSTFSSADSVDFDYGFLDHNSYFDVMIPSANEDVDVQLNVTGENTQHRLTDMNNESIKFAALNRSAIPYEVGWRIV